MATKLVFVHCTSSGADAAEEGKEVLRKEDAKAQGYGAYRSHSRTKMPVGKPSLQAGTFIS
jgi:hypothetical protein